MRLDKKGGLKFIKVSLFELYLGIDVNDTGSRDSNGGGKPVLLPPSR